MTTWKVSALLLAMVGGSGIAVAQTDAVQSLDVRIPLAPQPVKVGDDVQLFYELHVTSFTAAAITLDELVIRDAAANSELARFKDKNLAALIGPVGASKKPDSRDLATGQYNVIYVTLPLKRATPAKLSHRFVMNRTASEETKSVALDLDATPVDSRPLPEFGPPLRGGTWAALYDPAMERGHRRVLYAVDGHAHLPGRFAIDYFGVDKNGKTHKDSGERPSDYFGYGVEVLAVADGTVVATRDDFVEPSTLAAAPEHVSIGDATGVYVALDIGGGRYAFYEHMQPGLAVKVGQKVRRGERIGALGLTGSTMRPHLHFHVANANAPLAAEGMPYHLAKYRLLGSYDSIADFGDKPWKPLPAPRDVFKSLPAANVVVSFE